MISSRAVATSGAVALAALLGVTTYVVTSGQSTACVGGMVAAAAFGGPMALHDSGGRPVSEKDMLAGVSLLYFGYANCPDVCPVDNARNDEVANLLAEQGITATPVFVSVDPTRDTPEILAGYESAFSHLRAYSGSQAEIEAAAKAWKVYYNVPAEEAAKYKTDPTSFYTVDHTTMTYLTKPGGAVAAIFQRENTAEEIAKAAPCYLGSA